MWDWANRHWWCCFVPETLQKRPNQSSLLDAVRSPSRVSLSAAVARMFAAWLSRRRLRYLFLILCSPFLIPLIFAACPLICAAEVWLFVRRRSARGGDGRRGCGGEGDEVGLLQRYLEDQLMLAVGSARECGGDENVAEEEDGVDVGYFESARTLLQ